MQKLVYALFLSFLFVWAPEADAQNETRAKQRDLFVGQPKAKVVIVPYEGKMLLSDINRELGSEHDMTLPEIKDIFREGLCQMVAMEGSKEFDTFDMINSGEKAVYQDIQFIFNNLGYKYTEVPKSAEEEEEENVIDRIEEKVEEKQNPKQKGRGVYVAKGEIRSNYDNRERFMDARILKPELFEYLQETYEADYFFFITQLDVKVMRTPEMPEWTTAERRLKMHYTIFDGSGEKVAGSASYAYFGPEVKDIFQIVKNYFPILAEEALKSIPTAEEEEEQKSTEQPDEEQKQESSPSTRLLEDDDDDF
ncbi:hypothetical protein [Halocola ammonii]